MMKNMNLAKYKIIFSENKKQEELFMKEKIIIGGTVAILLTGAGIVAAILHKNKNSSLPDIKSKKAKIKIPSRQKNKTSNSRYILKTSKV